MSRGWLFPINIPVHVLSEIAKPLSLSVRLFGNMLGEDTTIARMIQLGVAIFAFSHVPVPVQIINLVLHMLVAPIQAFIFFMLAAAYIQIALTEEGGEHEKSRAERTEQPGGAAA